MPATLHSISGKTKDITIYLGDPDIPVEERDPDDSFDLTYRAHGLTGKVVDMASKAEENGAFHISLCQICARSFIAWDLKPGPTNEQVERLSFALDTDDVKKVAEIRREMKATVENQSPIEISYESLMENIPLDVLVLIVNQIGEARNPNRNGTGEQ